MVARADLFNRFVELHNQAVASGASAATDDSVEADFQAQNAAAIKAQAKRASLLAAQAASQPLPTPPTLVIPAGASPQMQAFLILRDQMMRGYVALWNQYLNADPSVRDQAMEQWRQQNAASFQALQQMAQQLAQSNSQ